MLKAPSAPTVAVTCEQLCPTVAHSLQVFPAAQGQSAQTLVLLYKVHSILDVRGARSLGHLAPRAYAYDELAKFIF